MISSCITFVYTISQVLLLEAGIEEPAFSSVPGLAPLQLGSKIDWNYTTQPDKHMCRSRPGGMCDWARGKVMGGSSTINYMIYTRGNMEDYNEWERMGNDGTYNTRIIVLFIVGFSAKLDV